MAIHPRYVVSLFSGIGGLDLAVSLAARNTRVVCYVEREAFPVCHLATAMDAAALDSAPVWSDVRTFDGRGFARRLALATGRGVWAVAGGFPCQDISSAGRREGIGGGRSGLWSEYIRIVREVRPERIFLENVSALVGRGLDVVLGDLAEAGFDAVWDCVTAAEVGDAQIRERLFLLAFPEGEGRTAPGVDAAARGQHVADADGAREQRGRVAGELACACCPDAGQAPERKRRRRVALDRGVDVADAGCGGCAPGPEQDRQPDGQRSERRHDALRRYPALFPPGPGPEAHDEWRRVLAGFPALEPTLRGMADGAAAGLDEPRYRLQRLAALGNAVVPLAAAVAFRRLARRAGVSL